MSDNPREVVRAGYDEVSRRYRGDLDEPPEYEHYLHVLGARLRPGAEVLDLGCGCGVPMSRRLAESGHRVLGVDASGVELDRARRLVPRARFLQADAAELSFADRSFDAIVCLYLLIHLPPAEQRRLVDSFPCWLRPGGVLVTTVGTVPWTGEDEDWLGGGARMWWSNPGADVYRDWLHRAGMTIEHEAFVADGSGHQLFVATVR